MSRLAIALLLIASSAWAQTLVLAPVDPQLPTAVQGRGYFVQFAVQSQGFFSYAVDPTTSLPPGLTLTSDGVLQGTPTTAGTYQFRIQAFTVFVSAAASGFGTPDSLMTNVQTQQTPVASRLYTLQVNPPLSIGPVALPSGQVGVQYNASIVVAGGLPPYDLSTSPQFPINGISFNPSTGALTGVPTSAGVISFLATVSDSTESSVERNFTIAIAAPALTITTTALPEGAVGRSYSATLTATGGTPPLSWSFTGALPAGVSLASNGVISGIPTQSGNFTILARVQDSSTATAQQSATATLQITIYAPLKITTTSLPTATRTQPYSGAQLQASGGRPPYTWGADTSPINTLAPGLTVASNGIVSGTPTATGTFTPPVFVQDSATGNAQQSEGADVTVQVFDPLAITTTSLPAAVAGVFYSQTLAATGGEPSYTWAAISGLPAGLTLSPSGVLSGTPTTGGNLNLQVRVRDSRAAGAREATATLGLNVSAPLTNNSPNPLPPATFQTPYTHQLTATGGVPPYTWSLVSGALPQGLTLSPGGLISGTPQAFGTFTFTIRLRDSAPVSNGAGEPSSQGAVEGPNLAQVDLQFTLEVRVSALTIVTPADLGSIEDGGVRTLTLQASGGAPPYSWSILSGTVPPQGMTLSQSGQLTGLPAAGTYSFVARVADRAEQAASREFRLVVTERRLPLEIITVALPDGNVGRIYAATFEARGGERPYVWSISGLPPGLAGDRDGSIVGRPERAGTFNVTAQVTDQLGTQVSGTFPLVVRPGTIFIDPSSAPEAIVDTPYALQFSASGGLAPYRFSISGTTPPGLSFANGALTGTPTEAGTFTFTVEATDEAQQRGQRGYTLVVRAGPLMITTATAPDGQTGVPYSLALGVRGGVRPYAWSSSGSLPPGLSLDTQSGAISGTPTTLGTFTFTAQVSDAQSATANRTFTVNIRQRLEITGNLPSTGAVGTALSGSLAAAGGLAPYRWSVSGETPPGTSFSEGSLSGTPTTTGSFSFTVQLTDATQAAATRGFTIEILGPMRITTESLPEGRVGTEYSQTLGVEGGRAPHRWSASGLPAGISISDSGAISGTPTESGSFSVAATVRDSSQPPLQASRAIGLRIGLPAISSVVIGGLPDTPPPAQQSPVNVTIGAPYPSPIQGTLTLAFAPDAVNNADDPAIQFSTGGRTVSFTIPTGSTQSTFPAQNTGVQTGTVAGTITLTTSLTSGGNPVPCDCPLTRTIRINRAAPVITNVRVTRTATGFNVIVTGYATSREVTQGVFRFSGTNLPSTESSVNLGQVMNTWFQSEAGQRFGSQFVLTMPFTIQGDANSVNSVSVTLSNAVGSSQAVSANF